MMGLRKLVLSPKRLLKLSFKKESLAKKASTKNELKVNSNSFFD